MAKIEHETPEPVVNPETLAETFAWMTRKGFPLLANGAVEDCDCDDCLAKYDA
jgi:hypothetical protein